MKKSMATRLGLLATWGLLTLPAFNAVAAAWIPRVQPVPLPSPLVSHFFNAPNPVDTRKGQTTLFYHLEDDAAVTLTLYDLFGHEVQRWDFGAGSSGGRIGDNSLSWNGTNAVGQKVSKGGYIALLSGRSTQGTFHVLHKVAVIH